MAKEKHLRGDNGKTIISIYCRRDLLDRIGNTEAARRTSRNRVISETLEDAFPAPTDEQ